MLVLPLKAAHRWAELRRDRPDLFDAACGLEDLLNGRRRERNRDPVWLTRFNRPLGEAIAAAQPMLPTFDTNADDVGCDNGVCFT